MKKVIKILIVCALVIGAFIAFSVNRSRHGSGFTSAYEHLALGMPLATVLNMMGSPPECEYRYKSFIILYFRPPPSRFSRFFNPYPEPVTVSLDYSPGKVVSQLDKLPDLYGFVQLAFDSNDTLCAYTWIGESYTVESLSGSVKGSHLSKLTRLESYKADRDQPVK